MAFIIYILAPADLSANPISCLCSYQIFIMIWRKDELMMRRGDTYIGFDTILNIWYPGHDIIQRGDICDDGFLVGVGHIHICKEKKEYLE